MVGPPRGPYPPAYGPGRPWYGRYWGYYNRPRAGCGCLYTLTLLLVIYWLLSLVFTPLAFW